MERYADGHTGTLLRGRPPIWAERLLLSVRGAKQGGLAKSIYCNDYKVSEFGRDAAIERFATKLNSDPGLISAIWAFSGRLQGNPALPRRRERPKALKDSCPEAFDRDRPQH